MCDCSSGTHDASATPEAATPAAATQPGLSRRLVLAGGLAAGAAPFLPGLRNAASAETLPPDDGATSFGPTGTKDYSFLPPRPASEKHVRPIMFPVLPDPTLGKATWTDTYLAPRSGGRKHEGQDLIGKKLLKLLAVADATIVELKYNSAGNSLYLMDDDGWYYAYLHINNDTPGTDDGKNPREWAFAPGMEIGKRVLKGEHVAYLGDSGNAESTVSHCHFEIRMPNAHWYNAAAVQASYSLTAAEPAKLRPKVPASAFAPLSGAEAFAKQQATDFLGGLPAAPWLDKAVQDLEGGVIGLDAFVQRMMSEHEFGTYNAPLIRLYLGYFLRIPDYHGLDYWIRKCRAGTPLDTASSEFAGGTEFKRRYGSLDNAAFVKRIYENLFDREPDASGGDYWKRRLDGGAKRGWVMRQLCESSEYRRKTLARMQVIGIYTSMLHRSPDPSGYDYWSKKAVDDAGVQALIKSIRTGTGYKARFPTA
jgi:murein DD-endopeptidase MepM/ murein hydrolase activator NlpD